MRTEIFVVHFQTEQLIQLLGMDMSKEGNMHLCKMPFLSPEAVEFKLKPNQVKPETTCEVEKTMQQKSIPWLPMHCHMKNNDFQ